MIEKETADKIAFVENYSRHTVGYLIILFIAVMIMFIKSQSDIGRQQEEIVVLQGKIDKIHSLRVKQDEMMEIVMTILKDTRSIINSQTASIKDLKNIAEIKIMSQGSPDIFNTPAMEEMQPSTNTVNTVK